MKSMLVILFSAMLTNNFVLSKFMGICPFLGVSKKLDSAAGMGAAVTFVMVCATVCTYPVYTFLLAPSAPGRRGLYLHKISQPIAAVCIVIGGKIFGHGRTVLP